MIENIFTSLVRYANISSSLLPILFEKLRFSIILLHGLDLLCEDVKHEDYTLLHFNKSPFAVNVLQFQIKYNPICCNRYLWSSKVGITLWLLRCYANMNWEYHLFAQMHCQNLLILQPK